MKKLILNNKIEFNTLYKYLKEKKISKNIYIKKNFLKHQILFDYQKFLKSSEVISILIKNKEIEFKIKNNFFKNKKNFIKLIVDKNDSRCIPLETFNFKKFESNESYFLFYFATKAKNIIDIGANVGWYSLNFNLLKNVKKIYSFEPIPNTFKHFKSHIKINNAKKITANNFAITNKNSFEKFFVSSESGSASLKNIQNKKKISKIKCRTITLDMYLKKKNKKCDLIKVDVEGAELLVFKGSIVTLKKDKPIVFTEMLRKWSAKFKYHPNEIINFFKKINYSCYIVKNKNLRIIKKITKHTIQTNFFFLHNIKHKKII